MEESGITQKQVGGDVEQTNWRSNSKNFTGTTQVLFVKKITQQMVDDNVFPSLFRSGSSYYGGRTSDSVIAGKKLGTMLGKKLQVRSESRTLKNSRLDSGRIDKRLIAELGFGNSKVFSTTFVENYNDAILHISVDASGSMGGEKWKNTMTAVVAICKAASMISGLDVVVLSELHIILEVVMVVDNLWLLSDTIVVLTSLERLSCYGVIFIQVEQHRRDYVMKPL